MLKLYNRNSLDVRSKHLSRHFSGLGVFFLPEFCHSQLTPGAYLPLHLDLICSIIHPTVSPGLFQLCEDIVQVKAGEDLTTGQQAYINYADVADM